MTDPVLRRLALGTILPAFPGTVAPSWATRLLREGLAGYTLFGYNIADQAQLATLVAQLRDARPDCLLALDEEGGDVTRLSYHEGSPYPGNAALGAADDPELTWATYQGIGLDLASVGINVNYAPTVDVNTADENPVIGTRSFGADPALVARHTAAAVAGLQSAGVAGCAKHFPGHGATVADSHLELPTIADSLSVVRSRDLPPFEAAIAAGIRMIMTAHIRVPELTGDAPATASSRVLVDLLRDELGFKGAVVTDALEMRGASGAIGQPEAAVRALLAGADLLCLGAEIDEALVEGVTAGIIEAVESGRLPAARLEEAVARGVAAGAGLVPLRSEKPEFVREAIRTAARLAVRVEGSLPQLREPLLVQLGSEANIAVGTVPWGLPLDGELVTVPMGAEAYTGPSADDLAAAAGDRDIVVVGRDTHRWPHAKALIEALAARHPGVVLVEMGWPSSWRPAGISAFVSTYGASRANGFAAVEALRGA
ncbi:glycoside hydrolase family 3 protein [Longispora albida]|uniref:glycoside hydrolase family 3 protein n=1 Tax=Longispora albida TaxID=203523 RepID=UPI00037522AC|nr:glycoside hydrolase family 3 protein [Longispora albida]